jgi:hypothetical protein
MSTKVNVGPKIKNPTHDLGLETDTEIVGLRLDGGPKAMQEVGQTPSTLSIGAGGRRWGPAAQTCTGIDRPPCTAGAATS